MCRSSQEDRVIAHCCKFDIQCVALVRKTELLFIAVSLTFSVSL